MDLIIDKQTHKVNNFVNFLIENYAEEGHSYQVELVVKDKYDRKLIEKRKDTLKDNLLVFLNEEFEIIDQSIINDYDKFITGVGDLFSEQLSERIDNKDYKNHFVKYEIVAVEGDEKHEFLFYYLNLNE